MTTKQIRNAVFASTVALALSFGAAQALASPGARASNPTCPFCADGACNCEEYCTETVGGSGGFCAQRVCFCFQ